MDTIERVQKENNNVPILYTIKDGREQGSFGGTVEEKKSLIQALVKRNAAYIDIDYEFDSENEYAFLQEVSDIKNDETKLILSAHFFEGTPSFPSLKNRVQNMKNRGADIVKIAAMPHYNKDVLTVLRLAENLQRKKIKHITISMAEKGKISRLTTPLFGSEMMFAPLEKGSESASGQMSMNEMKQCFDMFGV